ncbi:ribulose-1,5 bisphosphate carboxylase/oxygenase large subunit N-methyltransferase, chloroplastic [Dorcoceras hygrometricum]|uniref:Ribulose-1,5 bisphosphate carboxylase/oxygenase large subunit N-methyltransferase, chloroplastic n=1 Tax=Dorcoceras hygrometricum TaxID=472368 RepID=A0A2Z7ALW8_9LAMI|nr:ribulose-1,5 bisphosphate carboxylase/oxygenase large subunit N-methyltransferase, chloroplastic [Dorcoceras hygrometricum]
MSLFDLQDVCIAIGSLATLDLPMVVDLVGIYVLKGPYCALTTTNWFLQALSVIPRGSWGDVSRRFTMIRWARLINHTTTTQTLASIKKKSAAPFHKPHGHAPPSAPPRASASCRTCSGHRDEEFPLKCRFPRETGRIQAPRCQQVGSGSATAIPTGGAAAVVR